MCCGFVDEDTLRAMGIPVDNVSICMDIGDDGGVIFFLSSTVEGVIFLEVIDQKKVNGNTAAVITVTSVLIL